MIYNEFNNLKVSKMGLGIMRHGDNQDYTRKLIDFALKNEINYFEACDFYLNKQCELRLGDALKKYPRDSYILCDKLPLNSVPTIQNLDEFFNNQLLKTNVDYFDVYLIQALDQNNFEILEKYDVLSFLIAQKEKGKIKNLGFSFHGNIEVLQKLLKLYKWDLIQLQLNYYDWILGEAKDLYFLIKEYNIPISVMGPTKGGLLINNLPQKSYDRMIADNINPIYLCYSFLTTLDNVKIVLSGGEKIEMIQDNLNYFNNHSHKLSQREWEHIKKNIQDYQEESLIQCTKCNYCADKCPVKLPISKIFEEYNNFIQNKDLNSREFLYNAIHGPNSIQKCRRCNNCVNNCPQHLKIPEIFNKQIFPVRR